MKSSLTTLTPALAFCVLLLTGPAVAHDPGISRLSLQPGANGLELSAVFALRDLELVAPADLDHDGRVSTDEWTRVAPAFGALAPTLVQVRLADKALTPTRVELVHEAGDGIRLQLGFDDPPAGEVTLTAPVLADLGAGHRMFLQIRDRQGAPVNEALLSARQPEYRVQVGAGQRQRNFLVYLALGAEHIWLGFDHLLFLLTLLLPAVLIYQAPRGWQPVEHLKPALMDTLKVVTAFTAAHSITLSAATLGWLQLPTRWVESAIALSVLVAALNNLRPLFANARWLAAFAFGLIHGLGFAGALQELGLPTGSFFAGLLGFNLGVELGQLLVVALLLPLAFVLREGPGYRRYVLQGGSMCAAAIATLWLWQRASGLTLITM
jgi:hypothetical protein